MWNKFTMRIMLLMILVLSVSGCWWSGAGTMHVPRNIVRCDNPWVVRVMYTNDPKDWRVNLAKEAETFSVHYRLSLSKEFVTVPMVIEKLEPKLGRAYLKADMPVVPCDSNYVEYFYDHINTYSNSYNCSQVRRVLIGHELFPNDVQRTRR